MSGKPPRSGWPPGLPLPDGDAGVVIRALANPCDCGGLPRLAVTVDPNPSGTTPGEVIAKRAADAARGLDRWRCSCDCGRAAPGAHSRAVDAARAWLELHGEPPAAPAKKNR